MMVDNNGVGEMTWPLASMNTSNIAYDNHAEASGREPRLSTYGAPQRCQTEPRNSQGARSCFDGECGSKGEWHFTQFGSHIVHSA